MSNFELNFWFWIVKHLPKKIIYFATMHLGSLCTTGEFSSTIVPDLTLMDAVSRYHDNYMVK